MTDQQAEEELDYRSFANSLKDQGNASFQRGDTLGAIALFTQAIDMDPDNHVFYSNRSAAYMKASSISKALRDAEKCVELAPAWSKGYNRLGVAQQCLKRFDAAMDTFKKGIEVDPNNKALWAAMQACKDASEQDRELRHASAAQDRALEEERIRIQDNMKRYHEEEKRRQEEAKKEEDMMNSFFSDIAADDASGTSTAAGSSHAVEESNEGDDDLLADFFNEVTETTNRSDATAVAKAEALEAKDQNTLTEKYSNQVLEDGKHQYERLLAPHFEWRNLNPYFVFQLGVDATDEDIKYRYKKLSLKVHPDRLRGVDNPNDAFEQVKLAYAKLCDQDQRKNIIYHVERITEEVTKERRKLIGKGVDIDKLPDVTAETDRRVMKHFAEMERMRRRSETNLRAYSARDKMKEAEEHAKISKAMERDKSWGEENRREKRVGNWREFQDDPDSKKAKASSYKEESREEKKHGTVKVETWKKSWK